MGQTTHLHCTVRDLGDRTVGEIMMMMQWWWWCWWWCNDDDYADDVAMMMTMMMTIVMMTARQWQCQCALPQSLPTKRVVGFKGRCIFLSNIPSSKGWWVFISNIPSSSAHLWFKHSQHSRREKAKNQSVLISVVVRQDTRYKRCVDGF